MFGFDFGWFDIVLLAVTLVVTVYVMAAKNPHETGTKEYESLRLCRIGLAFWVWSLDFGFIGFGLALVTFILAILGITKGRTVYGALLIVAATVLTPVFNMARMMMLFG